MKISVRVYGLLLNDKKEILLSEENTGSFSFIKFPGGGLEPGEGTVDCLVREYLEETAVEIRVLKHIYTCDFFVQSRFDPQTQVIGIYYLVKPIHTTTFSDMRLQPVMQPFAGGKITIKHTWLPADEHILQKLTFEMDKKAWKEFMRQTNAGRLG